MSDHLAQRGRRFYYRRRVPEDLRKYDPRLEIKISLKTGSAQEARRLVNVYNDFIEDFWRDLVTRGVVYSGKDYQKAVSLARAHGFAYKSAADVSRLPLRDIIARFDTADAVGDPDDAIVSAVLGGVTRPPVILSTVPDRYWPISADKISGKTEHQIKRWRIPRTLAVNTFIQVVGDRDIASITRRDAILFWQHLMDRLAGDDIAADTANKLLYRTRDMLQAVSHAEELDIDFKVVFADLKFSGQSNSRRPFDVDYVQKTFIASDALSGLNDEAKNLVLAMADSGAGEGELIGLRPIDIFLDEDIPYIWIRQYKGNQLKTGRVRERKIPLVGVALQAIRKYPQGFSRYSSADSASSSINKYLRENNLNQEGTTLYSLRHTFKDRLRDIGAPEEVIDSLMGHATRKPKYGRGHLMETKYEWLQKIAFRA